MVEVYGFKRGGKQDDAIHTNYKDSAEDTVRDSGTSSDFSGYLLFCQFLDFYTASD